ncbi:peptide deformylase [bacterium]|nr:peptide deformylase [bacterium]
MRKIVTYPDPVLRLTADPVEIFDEALHDLLDEMQEIMYADDGVGLAAPQIGLSKRIIVLDDGSGPMAFLNPEVISCNEETETVEEGCLSLPDIRVPVSRPTQVRVTAQDASGQPVTIDADGLLARIFQHEIDHLNGKLIIDHVSAVHKQLLRPKLKQLEKSRLA